MHAWLAHFTAVAQRITYEAKPSTTSELINVMEQFAFEISEEKLVYIALDVLDSARLCLYVNGGHFQQLKNTGSERENGPNVLKLSKIHY